jgi:lipopolysaccharide biosynthesis regulator YciM
MGKTMCETGKKKAREKMSGKPRYECSRCHARVKKKDWLCKPSKI